MDEERKLVFELLKAAGIPDNEIESYYSKMITLSLTYLVAFTLSALNEDEKEKLTKELKDSSKQADIIIQKLKEACESSQNKPDIRDIAALAKIKASSEFFGSVYDKADEGHKTKLIEVYRGIITSNPTHKENIENVINAFGKED
ncbi:hypothetical protein A2716_05185 [candidate division WWE3 bacterium RIFCSPHIGHO2_01_FULL_40_23]|uniref:Uncharacterized protein n=1 Tax=candidate division WWE3 bacterium RIFCSPLOWO2_01_FULL_41_18 TaxID=1802625 RepID=A0A1F4VDN3_UNCKA|nr:MAG: hypothetical protein A2716_05185 [candidate division WWE3 bacterium RIFCSPHIGHO2_01_FULL_40_23]OGC55264.1 MAG: hypothetical protein A3A78_04795 [candidate division WWE3 bacterium RIFCSPLOWO2_01_FULL_41_18]